jgi:holo-[acyl-carrier protein] synthase
MSRFVGIGVDLAHIPRFERVYARFGERFLAKCLHPAEIHRFHRLQRKDNGRHWSFLASRWACKEAAVKASGARLFFPELCVEGGSPRPQLKITGETNRRFLQEQGIKADHTQLSLSHDGDYAIAFVTMS